MENINQFDPIAWANNNADNAPYNNKVEMQPSTPPTSSVTRQPTSDTSEQLEALVQAIVAHGINLTEDYNDWLRVGFALAGELGEGGRTYFHRLSQMSTKYDAEECDKKFDNCLHAKGQGVQIETLFWMAGQAGIDLKALTHERHSREFCAECADAQPCAKKADLYNSLIINTSYFTDTSAQGCASAHSAQNSIVEEVSFHHTFSDKIAVEDWPSYFRPVLDSMEDVEGRDKMILGTLVVNSGMIPNFFGIYGSHTVFPPMYILFYGPSASRKGEIGSCQFVSKPLKNEIVAQYQQEMDQYRRDHSLWESKGSKAADKATRGEEPREPEYRSPIIPANSSASAAYLALKANEGWGIIFETEASALTQSLLSDYGDYSTGLLAAFHHEPIKMNRVKDKVRFDIDQPRLAIGLTCTPGQLPKLFPTFEDGLGNRFLYYGLNRRLEWISPFKKMVKPLDEVYEDLGKESLELYHLMKTLGNRSIQFTLNDDQIRRFNLFFSELLMEQFAMLGDGITSFIFRLGLSTFRIAMVLSLLRRYSDWDHREPFFAENEQALPCGEKDFNMALTIMNTLVNHTATIYSALAKDDEGLPGNPALKNLSQPERNLYDMLGDEFTTDEVKECSGKLSINPDTSRRYLGKYVHVYHLAERVKNGCYRKVKNNV